MMDLSGELFQILHWKKFKVLAREWTSDFLVKVSSSPSDAIEHPACQKIIAMGMLVVPYIIKEIRDEPDPFWPVVLSEITGENPIPKSDSGKIELMCKDWVRWWDEK